MLERSVLLDMKGESSAESLKGALAKLVEARLAMDELSVLIEDLRVIYRKGEPFPEYVFTLKKILADHPEVERVSLRNARYSNVARRDNKPNMRKLGTNLDDLLSDFQEDLAILKLQHDQTIEAFRSVLPVAEKGGFASMMLSGRAALPEKIMQSANMMLVFTQFYDRACQTTIAADMQVYPRGLEWLKPANKTWTPEEEKEKQGEQDKKQDKKQGQKQGQKQDQKQDQKQGQKQGEQDKKQEKQGKQQKQQQKK